VRYALLGVADDALGETWYWWESDRDVIAAQRDKFWAGTAKFYRHTGISKSFKNLMDRTFQ